MYHLKLPAFLFLLLVLLRCVATAPNNRFSVHFRDQVHKFPDREGWLVPDSATNSFLSLAGPRLQRGLSAENSHQVEKRKCNTATCVTQRLADFLIRSSNTIGTVYAPTNVGSSAYGKRDLQSPDYLPL
ncbi:calcitonin gene-related peptide [Chanos chanos]|uniref:Calcitonin gene-related peptide n=1 Tax=Chanos chanos TaxID=29144 RepID=A0A6J2VBX7_CHACN|nr:islet amyloid polypeptide [Chanos chanos]